MTTSAGTPATTSAGESTPPSTPPPPPAKVAASPAFGDHDISPSQPIKISVANGTITTLTMTNPDGKAVTGKIAVDGKSWMLGEDLGYDRTYRVSGSVKGANGATVPVTGSYTTVSPADQITTSVSPGDGAVVGVAAPVIVRFGYRVDDKKAVLAAMKITTTPKVEGAWGWVQHDGDKYPSLDWRPKNYWPEGTKVHVESNVYGVHFGGDYFGGDDVTSDFTIGRNQVVTADAKTHLMIVKRDGKTVATYPASLGMGDDPNSEFGLNPQFVSRSGIHVVMDKQETVSMSNGKYYQNAVEHWAVRISDNGEFVHANPNTVDVQGVKNVTHGCVNLSTENAMAYYQTAIYGDPVEITGTSVKLSASDGDIYDWAIPWSTWSMMS